MLEVIYRRLNAKVNDLRYFTTCVELWDWFTRQVAYEPTIIIKVKNKEE